MKKLLVLFVVAVCTSHSLADAQYGNWGESKYPYLGGQCPVCSIHP